MKTQQHGTVTEKAWGTARALYRDEHVELSRIHIVRGGYCSRHRHEHKDNGFLVVEGRLLLICYHADGRTERVLAPGDGLYTIAAGVDHRFLCLAEDTVAYELYCAEAGRALDPWDIVRADGGGRARVEPVAVREEETGA